MFKQLLDLSSLDTSAINKNMSMIGTNRRQRRQGVVQRIVPKEFKLKMQLEIIMLSLVLVFALFFLAQICVATFVYADNLTDLTYTSAFRGSFKWLSKVSFIGGPLQQLISIFSFIGMFFIVFQVVMTLTYLSNKAFWDNVNEIKNEAMQDQSIKNVFGLKGYAEGFIKGKSGSGLDSIVYLLYAFVPNIVQYSDFNEKSRQSLGLTEDESVSTWFLKTFPRKVLIIFFLSMGFSGGLFRAYAVVVDGMSAAAERVISYNLAGFVNKVLDSGDNYKFVVGHKSDDIVDKLQGGIAHDIYTKVLAKIAKLDPQTRLTIGKSVEDAVISNVTQQAIEEQLGSNYNQLTKADLENVSYQVYLSSNDDSSKGQLIDLSSLVGIKNNNGDRCIAHIIYTISGRADTTNYLDVSDVRDSNNVVDKLSGDQINPY